MKFKLLPFSGKTVWQSNKPFIWFLLSLLLIHSLLKIIFYQYNYQLLFNGAETGITAFEKFRLLKWSLAGDLLTLVGINSLLLFALTAGRLIGQKVTNWLTIPLFIAINSFAVILNLIDIFYFRFHFQRANADLLYVLDHPFERLLQQNIFIILLFLICIAAIIYLLYFLHRKLSAAFFKGNYCSLTTATLFVCFVVFFITKNRFIKLLVPTYPMIELKSNELPIVQNSFHTFAYSIFRIEKGTEQKNYMPVAACDSLMPIRKKLTLNTTDSAKKNIVLFIMESVPYEFFDTASEYKVAMPFFDSLLEKSTFYNNAFCYAHESNKGITAILAGIPTISDIPVYHSQYINMPITHIGTALKKLNYQSLFCIGDEYDNFGFAKCMNWLGIDKYYSQEDIPNYKKLPAHSMGLQDEYVLDFFEQKISQTQNSFFAINYNISTHYPYDIPQNFSKQLPATYADAMKAMRYYDYSLQNFFAKAKSEAWFSNTTFIFCSDHWLFAGGNKENVNKLSWYRIPIIIYDPALNKKRIVDKPVSQFDVLGTVLAIAGCKDSIISYGGNLLDSNSYNNYAISRPNNTLYQITDSSYILGFNVINNKNEYFFNYKKDKQLKNNLAGNKDSAAVLDRLKKRLEAFLQKSGSHFNRN